MFRRLFWRLLCQLVEIEPTTREDIIGRKEQLKTEDQMTGVKPEQVSKEVHREIGRRSQQARQYRAKAAKEVEPPPDPFW